MEKEWERFINRLGGEICREGMRRKHGNSLDGRLSYKVGEEKN